ncbi:MAG: M56 family metallopeptidase [Acidobacteriota bacterium]
MNGWMTFLDAPAARALARTLLDFLWQGAVIASLLALADLAAQGRANAARLRYALACAALALMVLFPAAGLLRRAASLEAERSSMRAAAAAAPSPRVGAPLLQRSETALAPAGERFVPLSRLLLAGWLCGVFGLSLRLLAGWRSAGRLAVTGTTPARPQIAALAETLCRRLAISAPVRILESAVLQVPAAMGVFRPAVLLPVSSLTGLPVEQIEALLAHELAHIRRHDYLVNLIQSAAETLLFYHPAVWWVSGRMRTERENCCDDLAVAATGDPMMYARALVDLEERRAFGSSRTLALAADGGRLLGRVARLFPQMRPPRHSKPRARAAGALGLACVLLVGAAARVSPFDEDPAELSGAPRPAPPPIPARRPLPARRLAPPVPVVADSPSPDSGDFGALPPVIAAPAVPPSPLRPAAAPGSPVIAASAVPPSPVRPATPSVPPAIATLPSATASRPELPDAVVEGERVAPAVAASAPSALLRAEELDSLRSHRVTPSFLTEIAALGYTRASTDDLISLRIHGVSPADVAEFQKVFGAVSLRRCIEFGIHGVTAGWIREIQASGISRFTPEEALSLRIHGVTPNDAEAFRQAGYEAMTAEQAVSLRIHGVEPRDAAAWAGPRGTRPTLDELVSARIHGVDARFAQEMRSAGFPDAGIDQLTSFRIHGVDASFVREMKAAGFPSLTAEEAIGFRMHSVTGAYVREMRELGVSALDPDGVVALRIHGVTADFVRSLAAEGYGSLSSDELTSLRRHGITAEEIRRWNRETRTHLPLDDLLDSRLPKRSPR